MSQNIRLCNKYLTNIHKKNQACVSTSLLYLKQIFFLLAIKQTFLLLYYLTKKILFVIFSLPPNFIKSVKFLYSVITESKRIIYVHAIFKSSCKFLHLPKELFMK